MSPRGNRVVFRGSNYGSPPQIGPWVLTLLYQGKMSIEAKQVLSYRWVSSGSRRDAGCLQTLRSGCPGLGCFKNLRSAYPLGRIQRITIAGSCYSISTYHDLQKKSSTTRLLITAELKNRITCHCGATPTVQNHEISLHTVYGRVRFIIS